MRNCRTDRGKPRRLPDGVAEALITAKEQHPGLSVRLVSKRARDNGRIPAELALPVSTVHRLFSREGLMVKKTDAPSAPTGGALRSPTPASCG